MAGTVEKQEQVSQHSQCHETAVTKGPLTTAPLTEIVVLFCEYIVCDPSNILEIYVSALGSSLWHIVISCMISFREKSETMIRTGDIVRHDGMHRFIVEGLALGQACIDNDHVRVKLHSSD